MLRGSERHSNVGVQQQARRAMLRSIVTQARARAVIAAGVVRPPRAGPTKERQRGTSIVIRRAIAGIFLAVVTEAAATRMGGALPAPWCSLIAANSTTRTRSRGVQPALANLKGQPDACLQGYRTDRRQGRLTGMRLAINIDHVVTAETHDPARRVHESRMKRTTQLRLLYTNA